MSDTSLDLSTHIDSVADVFDHTIELARRLSEEQGALATCLPGWTVKDNLAHMVGLEQVLVGSPHPDVDLPPLDHVSSEFDVYMEQQIHVRRGLPLAAIADELAGLAPRRLAQLREQAAQGDPETASVLGGTRPLSAALPIRVFDLWSHEQDIRRAVGEPARMDCEAARTSIERTAGAWAAMLAETVSGDGALRILIDDLDPVVVTFGSGTSHASLTMSGDVATQLGCGRATYAQLSDEIACSGDVDLIEAVAPHLAFTP